MPDPTPEPKPASADACRVRLRVLASGSTGNCALLTVGGGHRRRAALLDAGLSPRRTRRLLAESGVRPDQVDEILITHFDRDHCHPGWASAELGGTRIRFHDAHGTPARRALRRSAALRPFAGPFELLGAAAATPVRLAHDDEGVTAFRIDAGDAASLGYATDLGRVTRELVRIFAGVGTLAIESNYCPAMQAASDRPAFLKHRITGGRGHISNQQAAEAAAAIRPGGRLVLLHLSQQCNSPEAARAAHAASPVPVTLAHHVEPTEWLGVGPSRRPDQPSLFPAGDPIPGGAAPAMRA